MLVLSRRVDEKIVIPCIRAAIKVVAVKPGAVRLGIEAPRQVAVLRDEVYDSSLQPRGAAVMQPGATDTEAEFADVRHAFRNRLNNISLGLALLHRQLQAGMTPSIQATFDRLSKECQSIHERLQAVSNQEAARVA